MEINFIILTIFILAAFYTDVRNKTIPNLLTISTAVIGLLYHFIDYGLSGLKFSFLGMTAGLVPFLILYLFKAVGAGDVKLFAAIGTLTGVEFVLYSSMYAVIYAGIIGIVIVLFRRGLKQRFSRIFVNLFNFVSTKNISELKKIDDSKNNFRFPFMYAVLPSIITTYYYFYIY